MSTEEGNKLIHEFRYGGNPPFPKKPTDQHAIWYNRDWNLLMPVVRKIMQMKLKRPSDIMFITENDHYRMPIFNAAGEANIEELFPAVVKFIQWYNQSK